MSQIISSGGGVIPPGAAVQTLTGNDLIAVGPDGLNNIDLVGVGNLSVTNTAANTLSITDINDTKYEVTTNDANPTLIHSIPVAVDQAITVTATFVGARDDFSAALWGELIYGAKRAGGAASGVTAIPTTTAIGQDSTGGATIGAAVIGNDLVLFVTGVAAQTWNWTATAIVLEQN